MLENKKNIKNDVLPFNILNPYSNTTVELSNWEYVKWLIKNLTKYKYRVLFLITLLIVTALLNVISPWLTQIAIDNYITQGKSEGLNIIVIYILILGVILAFLNFFKNYVSQLIGQYCVKNIRVEIFAKISTLSFSFFDSSTTGDLISRVMSDTNRIQHFISRGTMDLFSNPVIITGMIIVMFIWNYYMGLIFVLYLPILLFVMRQFVKKIAPIHRKTRKINGNLTSSIRESLDGINEIKIYGQEERINEMFKNWNENYFETVIESNIIGAKWRPFIPFLISSFSTLILIMGGILYSMGDLSIGLIIASLSYVTMVSQPVQKTMFMLNGLNNSKAAGERIFGIFKIQSEVSDEPNCESLKSICGEIEFKDVSFSYIPKVNVLENINLKIKPGQMVAFVGPSGVGKSTLLSLIKRFYQPYKGEILIDEKNISKICLKSLRKNIGTLMQESFLFEGSIKENILFGNKKAGDDKVMKAVEAAQIKDFILSLPDQFDTKIGERGIKLSGGQARRLCLARVLLTDPQILILDEPTSDIDAITDAKLISAIKNLMKEKTVLVIAHRLWTIKNSDNIVLLRDGKIEAQGNHENLINNSSFYQEFFASQFENRPSSNKKVKHMREYPIREHPRGKPPMGQNPGGRPPKGDRHMRGEPRR